MQIIFNKYDRLSFEKNDFICYICLILFRGFDIASKTIDIQPYLITTKIRPKKKNTTKRTTISNAILVRDKTVAIYSIFFCNN